MTTADLKIVETPAETADADTTPLALPALKAKPARRTARPKGTLSVLAAVGKGDFDAPAKAARAKEAKAAKKTTVAKAKPPKAPKGPSTADKIAQLMPLLQRAEGVTSEAMQELTGWKPHRVSWIMSQLRKDHDVVRFKTDDGAGAYRIQKEG